jgi:hypothetical protein
MYNLLNECGCTCPVPVYHSSSLSAPLHPLSHMLLVGSQDQQLHQPQLLATAACRWQEMLWLGLVRACLWNHVQYGEIFLMNRSLSTLTPTSASRR